MTKQTQTTDSDQEKKCNHRVELVEQQPAPEMPQLGLLPFNPQAAAGGGSIEGQAALLNGRPWQGAQWQALVAQMGRIGGNQHLQRMIASLGKEPVTTSIAQRQCACGQPKIAGNVCEGCRRKHETDLLQRTVIKSVSDLTTASDFAKVQIFSEGQRVRPTIQRKNSFGPTSGAPADWKTKLEAAKTSADKAALMQKIVGLTVSDATTASSKDTVPTAANLVEYSASSQKINYDDNLNTKKSPVDKRDLTENAGYTLHSGNKQYVILGPKSLDPGRYYYPIIVLNHELDHVRQDLSGSKLKGNESELDAWTSSFIRDFHQSYLLGEMDSGSTCYVENISTWIQLLDYYHRTGVSTTQQDDCAKRLKDYYDKTVKVHKGHDYAFRFWIYKSLKLSVTPNLAKRLNTDLKLGISVSDDIKTIRQFPCGTLKNLTYSPPSVDKPTFPPPKSSTP